MKKNYFKPEAEMLDFVVTSMIAASVGGGEGEGEEEEIPLSNKHRGEWGNVWSK